MGVTDTCHHAKLCPLCWRSELGSLQLHSKYLTHTSLAPPLLWFFLLLNFNKEACFWFSKMSFNLLSQLHPWIPVISWQARLWWTIPISKRLGGSLGHMKYNPCLHWKVPSSTALALAPGNWQVRWIRSLEQNIWFHAIYFLSTTCLKFGGTIKSWKCLVGALGSLFFQVYWLYWILLTKAGLFFPFKTFNNTLWLKPRKRRSIKRLSTQTTPWKPSHPCTNNLEDIIELRALAVPIGNRDEGWLSVPVLE